MIKEQGLEKYYGIEYVYIVKDEHFASYWLKCNGIVVDQCDIEQLTEIEYEKYCAKNGIEPGYDAGEYTYKQWVQDHPDRTYRAFIEVLESSLRSDNMAMSASLKELLNIYTSGCSYDKEDFVWFESLKEKVLNTREALTMLYDYNGIQKEK